MRGCLNLYDAIQIGVFHRPVAVRRLLRTGTSGTSGTRQASRGRTAPAQVDISSGRCRIGPCALRVAGHRITHAGLERAGLERASRGGRGARCLRLVVRRGHQRLTVKEVSVGAGELGSSAGGSLEQEGQAAVSASEDMTDEGECRECGANRLSEGERCWAKEGRNCTSADDTS